MRRRKRQKCTSMCRFLLLLLYNCADGIFVYNFTHIIWRLATFSSRVACGNREKDSEAVEQSSDIDGFAFSFPTAMTHTAHTHSDAEIEIRENSSAAHTASVCAEGERNCCCGAFDFELGYSSYVLLVVDKATIPRMLLTLQHTLYRPQWFQLNSVTRQEK